MDIASLPPGLVHYRAFKLLVENNPRQQLNSLVAFGLYMEAECRWADGLNKPPSDEDRKIYHLNGCMPHFLNQYESQAQTLLTQFGEVLVASHQKNLMENAVTGAIEAAHRTKKAFGRGVAEAAVGALAWTVVLIVISVIAQRAGIDLIEVYKHVAGAGS